MKMLVQYCWLSSLLFIVSTTALLSTSPSSHHTSTTKKSVVPTSTTKKSVVPTTSTRHSTSTTKQAVSSTHSSSHVSTSTKKSVTSTKSTQVTSSKTSTAASTSTPSVFYLVSADSGLAAYDGIYLHGDFDPDFPGYPYMVLDPNDKTSRGAANFSLFANGTLQWNNATGPHWASVSDGHPQDQPVTFALSSTLSQFGLDALVCAIASGAVTCHSEQTGATSLTYPYGTAGGVATLDIYNPVYDGGEEQSITLKVVPA